MGIQIVANGFSTDESQILFQKARDGDDSALWSLTEQLRPYLKAVVRQDLGQALRGKVDDSDVVQQAMVRAVGNFGDFEGASVAQWQSWLVTIAHNEARNSIRYWYQKRRDAYRERAQQNGSHMNWDPAGDQSTPSKAAIRRERAARLISVIQQLPEDQQQLIQWRHFDNLPHKEIAGRLEISEAACRQRWKSVLEKLNRMWDSAQ